ncbi:hypothetical protein HDU86_004416 [Geranomyces michiganensis]|nr:hypothetical protein HDU86_004416 [Geranomyces michiganensis]
MGFNKRPDRPKPQTHSSLSPEELSAAILKQVEYYFGDQNYPQDTHLHQIAALHENWVPIRVLCTFKKLRALSDNVKIVSAALSKSPALLELSDDGKSVRRRYPPPIATAAVKEQELSLKRERALDDESLEGPAKKPRMHESPPQSASCAGTIASALAAFHSRHFGNAARKCFPFPTPPAPTHVNDFWSRLCSPCASYWTDYYKYEQVDTAANQEPAFQHADQEANVNAVHLADTQRETKDYLNSDAALLNGGEEEQESLLTPAMIAIFRHSENWKREKAAYYAELERKEQEQLAAEAADLAGELSTVGD